MAKEYLGKQTVASLIRLVKNEFAKYTKKTDYAGMNKPGIVQVTSNYYGLYISADGELRLSAADEGAINNKTSSRPISPSNLDYAIKMGITTNKNALTDDEKAAVQAWLGVTDQIGDIETALDSIIAIQENLIGGDDA